MEPLATGYLSQLTKQGANQWKKRFFVLLPDGTLSISDKKGATPKQFFYLSNESDITDIPDEELTGEVGFYINVSAYQLLCVKSTKRSEISKWDSAVKEILKTFSAQAKKRERLSVSDIYTRMKNAETGSKGRVSGYTMKVGKTKEAIDHFVNARTFEYFASEDDCKRGKKPQGKAHISLLV